MKALKILQNQKSNLQKEEYHQIKFLEVDLDRRVLSYSLITRKENLNIYIVQQKP